MKRYRQRLHQPDQRETKLKYRYGVRGCDRTILSLPTQRDGGLPANAYGVTLTCAEFTAAVSAHREARIANQLAKARARKADLELQRRSAQAEGCALLTPQGE